MITTQSSLFPPERDKIHVLTEKRKHTGLSPPEEEELALLEGREAENDLLPDPEEQNCAPGGFYAVPGLFELD